MPDRTLPSPDPYRSDGGVPTEYQAQPMGYPGGAPGGWGEPEDDGLDWRRYLAALLRHKWLIMLGLGLGLVAGVLAERTLEPTYSVQSTIWIESSNRGTDGDAVPIRPSQLLSSSGWVDLMRSFAVLDPVVEELRLYVEPADPETSHLFADFAVTERVESGRYELVVPESGVELVLRTADGVELERVSRGGAVGESQGFRWIPPEGSLSPGTELAFTVMRPRDAARQIAQDLSVTIDRETTFLTVELSGKDPERITNVVNEMVAQYAQVAEQLKRARLDELTGILEEQLDYARENLSQAELELERFKVQTISLPSEQASPVTPGLQQTQSPVFQNFFNLKIAQEDARRDQIAIERALRLSQEQGRLATEALEVIPSVRESSDLMNALGLATEKRADLRALRLRYTDEHPAVQEVRDDLVELEQQTVPALASTLLAEVGGRQDEIERFVGQAAQELQQIPPRAVEETRLERRFQSAEDLFRELQGRYESARLGAASTIADVQILDRAQPPQFPSNDPRGRFFVMAMLAGLGLGLAGAILRDRIDPLLRRPDQVTRDLGLPILAAIPHARRSNGGLNHEDQQQIAEAFRNLRLAITYAHGPAHPLVVTVTSPGVGDGKSFTTSNLALAFAELGQTTLVIDGDVRRGTLHTLFASPRKAGLTDYLSGEAALEDVIYETEHPHLQVIPSGSRFRDAPELLGLPAMGRLMEEVRSRFEVILLDSSPLGAAVDPYLLGTLSGSLLVVLRNGITDRELAETRLGELTRLPIRLLGAVLNDVPRGGGPYRYYAYLSGYEPEDEESRSDVPRDPSALIGSR